MFGTSHPKDPQSEAIMSDSHNPRNLQSVLTLKPLLDFWRSEMVPHSGHMAEMFASFEQRILQNPDLRGDIADPTVLDSYQDILAPLMSVAFPAAARESEIAAALVPFTMKAFYKTPAFERLKLDTLSTVAGPGNQTMRDMQHQRLLRAYAMVLDQLYDIPNTIDTPMVRTVTDPHTQLQRYYRVSPDTTFVRVSCAGRLPELSDTDRRRIIDHIADIDVIRDILPIDAFVFRGFTIVRAVDVTEAAVIMGLERDLISQETIFSSDGFARLQNRLRTLFERSDLEAGIGAVQGEQVLILNDRGDNTANCLFRNSSHIPIAKLRGSVWLRAVEKGDMLRIVDLAAEPELSKAEQDVVLSGMRSLVIMPLFFQGHPLGTISIKAPGVGAFGPLDEIRLKTIAPLFSVALKRGLDDMNNEIQAVIKEKCTAVHPSVEWRFHEAALAHMERLRQGESSEMEPIIFKEVVPLFGQSDIRGSAEARIQSIQADLTRQLTLAGKVLQAAQAERTWPLLQEYAYRVDRRIELIQNGLSSEDESLVAGFLNTELEPNFDELRSLGPRVAHAVETYQQALDPNLGVIYRKRKDFEQSVLMLNERLSTYLDQRQAEAQEAFPHYFEKHQTDGLDYVIYLGASMHRSGRMPSFFIKNLGLWQLMVACGMAWHTEQIKPRLAVPLDTCHLVLYNRSPLAIRFRYDEKRFDVDGAYDVRHEIIKARLDKAVIKGGRQRLTQPGRVAIVYANPREGGEIRQHIEFLQAKGYLLGDAEQLDLDDLPGIRGLRAIRVGINLEAATDQEQIFKAVG
jgi:hypothetical protein